MCTSLVSNRKKTIVGWNLDILDMQHRIRRCPDGVYIEINDATEGWMPLFGANNRGDSEGNVLHIIPGQGYKYYEKTKYIVLTNFSPFKGKTQEHPWMGYDRYELATNMLKDASDDFDVDDCFEILKKTSQIVCPTVVSMVYDVTDKTVYWCENRNWDEIQRQTFA